VVEGQGANRFTRIYGEAEASATVEAEACPQLRRDWSKATTRMSENGMDLVPNALSIGELPD
jgi:hypothetical protein